MRVARPALTYRVIVASFIQKIDENQIIMKTRVRRPVASVISDTFISRKESNFILDTRPTLSLLPRLKNGRHGRLKSITDLPPPAPPRFFSNSSRDFGRGLKVSFIFGKNFRFYPSLTFKATRKSSNIEAIKVVSLPATWSSVSPYSDCNKHKSIAISKRSNSFVL